MLLQDNTQQFSYFLHFTLENTPIQKKNCCSALIPMKHKLNLGEPDLVSWIKKTTENQPNSIGKSVDASLACIDGVTATNK